MASYQDRSGFGRMAPASDSSGGSTITFGGDEEADPTVAVATGSLGFGVGEDEWQAHTRIARIASIALDFDIAPILAHSPTRSREGRLGKYI
jgi:hypothetical protein